MLSQTSDYIHLLTKDIPLHLHRVFHTQTGLNTFVRTVGITHKSGARLNLMQRYKSTMSVLPEIALQPVAFLPFSPHHHRKLNREMFRFRLCSPRREELMDFEAQRVTQCLFV